VIEAYYFDYWGNRVETPEATRRALLDAMGLSGSSFDEVYPERSRGAQDDTEEVIVVREGERPLLEPPFDRCSVELEDSGDFRDDLAHLPLGYHRLRSQDDGATCSLIVAPAQCYLAPRLRDRRAWALSTQLYALRSQRNWGIGDFTDLAAFAKLAGEAGARAVALNPLHELHPSNPRAASPYSPSSRLFLNVLYIDVESVPELAEAPEAQAAIANATFQVQLRALRDRELIDYEGVAALKLDILAQLHRAFLDNHWKRPYDRRAQAFRRFIRRGGTALERLAVYETLAEFLRARDSKSYGWLDWPNEFRSPDSPHVARFAAKYRERVDFYLYLQWIADAQLTAAARTARQAKAAFYCDLAVGVDRNGADAWADQAAFVADASLGAPPDPLNTHGQNWGLAPLSPLALRMQAYQPFIALLRTNMRHAAMLRIDHVMSLRRAFWIPRGASAALGAYVRYPIEDLLGIVALESVRNRCIVVGEDLGTVPEGFRERMTAARALSTRLFYFERDSSDGSFLPPKRYPRLAAASIGTHDLPTLAGWWTGDRGEGEDRRRDRFLLVDALERAGAIDAAGAARLREDAERGGTPAPIGALTDAAHRFLGSTPSALVVVAIEDVLHETGAVNVPGTFDEHPNWRRKRSLMLESIEPDGHLMQTGAILIDR
jgi:4-alpha-glucanotransferase